METVHLYVQGEVIKVVTKELALERVSTGEWYRCNAEHNGIGGVVGPEEVVAVYHKS